MKKKTRGRKEEKQGGKKQQKPLKRNLAGDGGSCFLPLGAKQPNHTDWKSDLRRQLRNKPLKWGPGPSPQDLLPLGSSS